MIGSRAWFALMRRNLIYRKRNWIGTLLEIILPIAFVGILVAIKGAGGDDTLASIVPPQLPTVSQTFVPLSFTDYVTALQVTRQCVKGDDDDDDDELWISGIANQGSNWQVPFVKCDSRNCKKAGQDAQPFCEYAIVAVAPSSATDAGGLVRANLFREWVYTRYPALTNATAMPFDFDFVRVFDNPDEIKTYVKAKEYGNKGFPKIVMGIVWEGNNDKNYIYSLRQNSTNFNAPEEEARPASQTTPDTDRLFDSFANNDFSVCIPQDGAPDQGPLDESCTGQYLYNGVLTFQRLIGDFVLDNSGAKEAGVYVSEAGVKFVQFPTRAYEES